MTPLDSSISSSGLSSIVGAEAISLAMLNAVARQQLDSILAQAVTLMGACEILSIAPAETATKRTPAYAATTGDAKVPSALAAEMETALPAGAPGGTKGGDGATGAAAQLIALAIALSVQDAANYLRNVQTLNTAAMASSLLARTAAADGAEEGPTEETGALASAKTAMDHGRAQFKELCQSSVETLRQLRSLGAAEPEAEIASSVAERDLLQATIEALSDAVHNVVTAQQQANVTAQAATTMGVATLYSVDTAALGVATKKILDEAQPVAQNLEPASAAS